MKKVTKGCEEATRRYGKLPKRKQAYEDLKFYQDICALRRAVYKISERFSRSHLRLTSQMRDAARSVKQNIREGYRRGSLGQFIQSIKISQASLEEPMGDLEDCKEDDLITADEFQQLSNLSCSADFLMARYLKSLYKIKNEGSWKTPNETGRVVTSHNLS